MNKKYTSNMNYDSSKFGGKYRIASARKIGWNYGWNGSYFVTICTKNKIPYFGTIDNKIINVDPQNGNMDAQNQNVNMDPQNQNVNMDPQNGNMNAQNQNVNMDPQNRNMDAQNQNVNMDPQNGNMNAQNQNVNMDPQNGNANMDMQNQNVNMDPQNRNMDAQNQNVNMDPQNQNVETQNFASLHQYIASLRQYIAFQCHIIAFPHQSNFVSTHDFTRMNMTQLGNVARKCWLNIPRHFPFVQLDAFVIMPNHIHGILIINKKQNQTGKNCFGPQSKIWHQ